jgi:hypothetical protein
MKALVAVVALGGAHATAYASTWHVAPIGNDSNDGSATSPWRTIQTAANAVMPGDTVMIQAGTYTGFVVSARGTAQAPITFTGVGAVNIDGAATVDRDAVHIEGASYVVIEGLRVTGAKRAGISALECDHITIRNNHVDANARWGVFSSFCDDLLVENNEASRSGTEHGIYASNSADRPVIRGNLIWGNGMCGVHMNGDINFGGDGVISGAIIEDNVIRDNGVRGGSAINGDGVTGALIRNNVIDGNHASGISLYQIDGGAPSSNNTIVNNTVRMASDARWAVNIQDGAAGNVLRNNILLHPAPARGAVDLCATCMAGLVSEHNVVVGRFQIAGTMIDLATWSSRTGDTSSFTANDAELFMTATDLTLRTGSPAIDRGIATGAPATDARGTLRPQGNAIDIGAYEYCDGACVGDGGDEGDTGDGSDDDGSGDGNGGPDYSGQPASDPDSGGCDAGRARGESAVSALLVGFIVLAGGRRRAHLRRARSRIAT